MTDLKAADKGRWRCVTKVEKYHENIDAWRGPFYKLRLPGWLNWMRHLWSREAEFFKRFQPYDTVEVEGNLLLNEGINNMWNLICGAGGTAYNNANARIGVGDSSTAAAASQTDLQAATNKLYKAMDGGFPTSGTSQQAVFKSTFGTSDANYAWAEWTVDNGSGAALNMNRKVESLGTKVTGSWALTVTLSLS